MVVMNLRLTTYTDYSLRVLIYLAAKGNGQQSTITEIAEAYDISRNHLVKVIHELGKIGVIITTRGRGGGIRLAFPPEEIKIGELVRLTEEDFNLVECFEKGADACVITPVCGLKHVLNRALSAYLEVLDQYTLADIVVDPHRYQTLLQINNEEETK